MDENTAIQLLRKHSTNEESYMKVLLHSQAVQKLAIQIANKILKNPANRGMNLDLEFIRAASLLHDIGRFKCPPGKDSIKHGIFGGEILRKEKIGDKYARVCENHTGAGITKAEIVRKNLPLPRKDFIPTSNEEKIICYADKLLWGTKIIPIDEVIKRFNNEIDLTVGARIKKLHDEIKKMTG
jgi:uncharacterized protein (TIGR00295 family)